MRRMTFVRTARMPASAAEVYRWHERRGALERLLPPRERVRVVYRDEGVASGDRTACGVFLCGDYGETASLNGAMLSGRRAAESIIEHLAPETFRSEPSRDLRPVRHGESRPVPDPHQV